MLLPWAAAASLLVFSAPAASQGQAPLEAVFARGVEALKSGRLDDAESAFREVLQRGGKAAYVHNNLGLVYQQRGRHPEAVAQFREAVRLDASYGAPRVALGSSLLALGRPREASAELQRAVKLLPKEPLARLQLARAYDRLGDPLAAVEQYRALASLSPEDPEYAYQLARAYLRLSDWSLRKLRAVDPGSARLHQALGHQYRVQGRTEMAVSAFERAVRADPKLPEVHLALAQIHLEQGRWAEARREIDLELALVPDSAGALALKQRLPPEETAPR